MAKNPFSDLFSIADKLSDIIAKAIDRKFDREQRRIYEEFIREYYPSTRHIEGRATSTTASGSDSTSTATATGYGGSGSAMPSGFLKNIMEDVEKIAVKLGAKEGRRDTPTAAGDALSAATGENVEAITGHTETVKSNTKAIREETMRRRQAWRDIFEGFKGVFNVLKQAGGELLDAWGKVDQAAYDFQKRLGGTAAMAESQRANAINLTYDRHIGARYNTSADELLALQTEYDTNIGRRAAVTNDELETLAAMNGFMGKEKTEEFAKAYEIFGKNIEGTGTAVGKLFKDASDRGVAFEKYSKNVLNNIKLAQSYNFANGMKGLEDMARKATMLKIDMQQIAQLADKVSTVEGATSTAANLSVLGGSFSAFANPMSMLYEGLNDINALQDRVVNQFGNLAFFDRAKGEINMEAFDKQRVRAAAQAMGLNSNELMDMIFTNARINQIQPELDRLNVSDKTKDLIKNVAQLKDNGEGYVMLNGQEKKISQLTENDAEALKKANQSDSDNIKEITETLRGWNDTMSGSEKQYETMKAQLAETLGFGKTAKNIAQAISDSNAWLRLIFGAVTTLAIAGPGMQLLRGLRGLGGGGGAVARGSVAAGGRVGGGLLGRGITGSKFMAGARAANINAIKNGATGATIGQKLSGGLGAAGGRILTGGAIGGIGAGAFTALSEFGGNNDHMGREKWARTGGSTVGGFIGGALGSFLGPLGTMAGAALGSWVGNALGGLVGMSDSEKREFKKKFHMEDLLGYYTGGELQDIRRHRDEGEPLDSDLHAKLTRNGDTQYLANGGIISTHIANGPLHEDGGIKGISRATSRPVEFEGGELVLSREDTKTFLQAMQSWKEAVFTPKGNEFKPVDVRENTAIRNSEVSGSIKLEPLDIRINGTLKLETPMGQSAKLDFDKLLKYFLIHH